MSLNIIDRMCTNFKSYGVQRSYALDSIQVHSIGCATNSADNIYGSMNQYSPGGITHACVDAATDNKVLRFLPDNNTAWADKGYGNNHSYTFQIAESKYIKYQPNSANYSCTNEAAAKADCSRGYKTAVEFCAYLCQKFGFNPNDTLSNGLHRVYSHNEGRAKGLSSAHVDPEHWFKLIGKNMDTFRADVEAVMAGGTVTTSSDIKYKVRLTWENESSQLGAYVYYEKAVEKANQNPGYTVFDLSGKALYASKGLPSVSAVIANQTKEKSLALLATLPDYKGLPDSQADYINKVSEIAVKLYPYTRILPSVVIAQAFLENGGGTASDALELTKRSNLIGQKAELINSTWQDQTVWDGQKFSKRTPEVYNGVPTTITAYFRVFPNYAYSILDYEMFLTHVKLDANTYKYRKVVGMTDPQQMITHIRNMGYATGTTYITSVMRIVNQYSLTQYDKAAIKALQDETDAVIPVIPTTTPSTTPASSTTEQIQYKVGTAISSSGVVTNQIGAFAYLDKAKEYCDKYGSGYKVFMMSDNSVVYEAPASSPSGSAQVENAVQWALKIAADNTHGYDQANRWGPDYDCSSLVISAFEQAGIKVKTAGATYTGNMYNAFIKCGFTDVTSKITLSNGTGLIRGDVLLNKVKHTAIYIGNGQIVHSSRNEKGGATGGSTGDQDGKEILTRSYYNSPWDCVLRFSEASRTAYNPQSADSSTTSSGGSTTPSSGSQSTTIPQYYRVGQSVTGTTVIGQVGAYTEIENAIEKANQTGLIVFDPNYKAYYYGIKPAEKFDKSLSKSYTVSHVAKLRSGPGTEYRVLDTLQVGTKVNCYGYYSVSTKNKKWYYVLYNGKVGHILAKYIK